MAILKNISTSSIPVMINGKRKSVKPGEIVEAPESLASIPGFQLLSVPSKNTNIKKDDIITNEEKLSQKTIQIKKENLMIINSSDLQNFSDLIQIELDYQKKFLEMNTNPSVTIAILTKNHLNLIQNCCESIFKEVNYKNVNLMICDTGTNDVSVLKYYSNLSKKCMEKNWKFEVINLKKYHFGNNYNTIIFEHIKTDYVLIQNNDTTAINDYVSEMMGTAVIRKVGSVGCRMFYPNGPLIQHDGQLIFNAPGGRFGNPGHIHLKMNANLLPPQEANSTKLVDGNTAAGVLIDTKLFKDIGGFDIGYKDIFQDVDLMVKIPNLAGKYNYCNRKALITHIDNASRLGQLMTNERAAEMMKDVRYLQERLNKNNWFQVKKPKEVEFSIITLVHDFDKYKMFLESLKSQIGNHSIEIIGIPNYYNIFDSVFKAYNVAQDVSSGKVLIFCHDDIVVTNDWLQRIKQRIVDIESQRINWGVLGPAGIFMTNNKSAFFLLDENGVPLKEKDSNIVNDHPILEVFALDELCLITKKNNNLRFAEDQLSGFHFYGGNICLEAQTKGLRNFAIDSYCHHMSDGYKNISTEDNFNEYEKCANKFKSWAKIRGFSSWRTTTAICHNDQMTFFVSRPSKNINNT